MDSHNHKQEKQINLTHLIPLRVKQTEMPYIPNSNPKHRQTSNTFQTAIPSEI